MAPPAVMSDVWQKLVRVEGMRNILPCTVRTSQTKVAQSNGWYKRTMPLFSLDETLLLCTNIGSKCKQPLNNM